MKNRNTLFGGIESEREYKGKENAFVMILHQGLATFFMYFEPAKLNNANAADSVVIGVKEFYFKSLIQDD